jgi:outer membrane protein OmpA-like peptidoglycan-associated protein
MKMTTRFTMAAALLAMIAAPTLVQAQANPTRAGWYVGAGALATFPQDADSEIEGVTNTIKFNPGFGVVASGGYAWGNGVRTEGEFGYRRASIDEVTGTGAGPDNGGRLRNISFMGNVLYDFNTGTRFTPYIGAGVGTSLVDANNIRTVNFQSQDSTRMKFAYQAIGGVSYWLDNNWSATLDYRYFRTTQPKFKTNLNDRAATDNASHNVVVGIRYTFGEPARPAPAPAPRPVQVTPPPAITPAPVAAPAVPPVPQSYMVFFDFDQATLTPEAQRIIASAAQDFNRGKYVRINVTGHTDTTGGSRYNQRLSERRAATVQAAMARLGVPAAVINTAGLGKSALLVPTNDNVREAQNRRAEIVLSRQ